MGNYLHITKIRKVKTPTRAHSTDAGIDFFVPEDLPVEKFLECCKTTGTYPAYEVNEDGTIKSITLVAGESVLLPSGIRCNVPQGYMLQFINKSGVASKFGLMIGAAVVDAGYDGEVHINLLANYNRPITIEAGQKIAQGIIIPVNFAEVVEVDGDTVSSLNSKLSERGAGGFGSTSA